MTGGAIPIHGTFDAETKAFMLSELDALGSECVLAGLESVLMSTSGEIVSTGVTDEMRDGNVAAILAAADLGLIALGHGRVGEDPEVVAAMVPYAEELRAETGLADLIDRVLGIVADPESAAFAGVTGTCVGATEFQALLADLRARAVTAKASFPGTWDFVPLEAGTFKVTMFPEVDDEAVR